VLIWLTGLLCLFKICLVELLLAACLIVLVGWFCWFVIYFACRSYLWYMPAIGYLDGLFVCTYGCMCVFVLVSGSVCVCLCVCVSVCGCLLFSLFVSIID